MPTRIIKSGRTGWEWVIVGMCLVVGVAGLFDPQVAGNTLTRDLPAWELYAWHAGLAMSGGITLLGLRMTSATGLAIERFGLWVFGVLFLSYGAVILVEVGVHAIVAGAVAIAFGAAGLERVFRITRDIADVAALSDQRLRQGR